METKTNNNAVMATSVTITINAETTKAEKTMSVNEFVNFWFAILLGSNPTQEQYESNLFVIPRIQCNDGFSISVQAHYGAYCGSENGYRKLGHDWKQLEWGYPSQEIDFEKYNADYGNDVGSCSAELLDELIAEHKGIDVVAMGASLNAVCGTRMSKELVRNVVTNFND